MVVIPRRRTLIPPPGAPEFELMTAPVILPLMAPSSVCGVEISASSRDEMVSTELARFSRRIDDPRPVTTTSSSPRRSSCRATSSRDSPTGTWTSRVR